MHTALMNYFLAVLPTTMLGRHRRRSYTDVEFHRPRNLQPFLLSHKTLHRICGSIFLEAKLIHMGMMLIRRVSWVSRSLGLGSFYLPFFLYPPPVSLA